MDNAVIKHRGRSLEFAVDDPDDHIQRRLLEGTFYEPALLKAHMALIFYRSTVIDVGANIGNHTVFYATGRAGRVYPFEPNPRANALLRRTVEQNDLDGVDLRYADLGVGAEPGSLSIYSPPGTNLGGVQLREDADGAEVTVTRLDDCDFQGPVSLIKVDVEGMEMKVLAGAEDLIAAHRPALGVEVDQENLAAFWSWVDAHDYHVAQAVKMYEANVNYVCIPRY